MIVLKQLFVQNCRMVKDYADLHCLAHSIMLREPREASKLTDVTDVTMNERKNK